MINEINLYINNDDNEWLNKYTHLKSMYKEQDINEIAQSMLQDIYFVPNVGYTKDIYNKDYNVSTLRLIHGFVFIYPLIDLYKKTKDKKYLDKCVDILEQWISKFRYNGKTKCMSFHDETTALRIRNLIYLFDISKNILEIDSMQIIYEEIRYTANILSKNDFYSLNTNHGFFQDISLIVYSKYFKFDANSNKYNMLAQERIKSYFEYIFTSDGVHKEHSPEYHFLIIEIIKRVIDDKLIKDQIFNVYLEKIYLNSLEFSLYIPKPNLQLPAVGDTKSNMYLDKNFYNLYDDISYKRLVNYDYENINLTLDYVSKQSGYAILRDSWGDKSTYVLLTAGYHTSYHKHCDDLSIIIYYKGDIISEAGPFGHTYNDEACKYGYSAFAHNTLIVNKKSLPRVDGKYDKVKITDYNIGDDETYVKAINSRNDNVVHERTLRFNKKSSIISIVDSINSNLDNSYTLLYHLPKDINPMKKNKSIYLYKADILIGEISVESDYNIELNYCYGDEHELIKGMNFPEMYQIDYNYVVYLYIENVKQLNIQTNIIIYK